MFKHLCLHLTNILEKNLEHTGQSCILLFDEASPLAVVLARAYDAVLPKSAIRIQFDEQKQEAIAKELFALPKDALVILVQSTNFRLSDFRIRLELFHRGIHVIEHNHLAYIPEGQFETFIGALEYHTPEYLDIAERFEQAVSENTEGKVIMRSGAELTFWSLEPPRANSGNYTQTENRWGTFPIGEVFTEAIKLESVTGNIDIFGYPDHAFQMVICEPFRAEIQAGYLVQSGDFPPDFSALLDRIVASEGSIMVREIGIGLNRAISRNRALSDVNYFERQFGMHLSLGKKHGIYGKKLPKEMIQRFHIDIFLDVTKLRIGDFEISF